MHEDGQTGPSGFSLILNYLRFDVDCGNCPQNETRPIFETERMRCIITLVPCVSWKHTSFFETAPPSRRSASASMRRTAHLTEVRVLLRDEAVISWKHTPVFKTEPSSHRSASASTRRTGHLTEVRIRLRDEAVISWKRARFFETTPSRERTLKEDSRCIHLEFSSDYREGCFSFRAAKSFCPINFWRRSPPKLTGRLRLGNPRAGQFPGRCHCPRRAGRVRYAVSGPAGGDCSLLRTSEPDDVLHASAASPNGPGSRINIEMLPALLQGLGSKAWHDFLGMRKPACDGRSCSQSCEQTAVLCLSRIVSSRQTRLCTASSS
jgi:hypothetical protein